MKHQPEIFYKIDGFLYRNLNFNEEDIITIYKEFREDTVQKSREKAFEYYHSLLDVLLESVGIKYQNQKQAEKDLRGFYFSDKKEQHPKLSFVTFNKDDDKLITISICPSNEIEFTTEKGFHFYKDEKIINAFGYESELLENRVKENLLNEKFLMKLII